METIINWTVPSPFRRKGFHRVRSSANPRKALAMTASGIASQIGTSDVEKARVMMAPKVTISPCAKLEIPVVPYTSERPIAASASMSPKLRPFTIRSSS